MRGSSMSARGRTVTDRSREADVQQPIDLGLDSRDPWAMVPTERREQLNTALRSFARIRREAEATTGALRLS